MSTEDKPKRGRPAGQPATKPDTVAGELTRCASCGSTNRDAYTNRNEQAIAGTTIDGKPYTHIIRRRTRCTDCTQARIDRHYENRPAGKK